MTSVASPIRHLRRLQGMTAEQLAARAGLASATVYRAERGLVTPGEQTLTAIAQALGVTLTELHDVDPATSGETAPHNTPAPLASTASESASGAR